jgi:hypothetical protein
MRCKQWSKGESKFPASMTMRIKLAAQIMKQFSNCGFFGVHTADLLTLRTFGAQINLQIISRKVLFDPHRFCQTNRLFILLVRAEMEICISMENSMFKTKMDIDPHDPRLIRIPINCQHLNPPYFSLPTTFKTSASGFWPLACGLVCGLGSSG